MAVIYISCVASSRRGDISFAQVPYTTHTEPIIFIPRRSAREFELLRESENWKNGGAGSVRLRSQTLATQLTVALKECHVRRKEQFFQTTYMRAHPEKKRGEWLVFDPFELLFPVEALLLRGHNRDADIRESERDHIVFSRHKAVPDDDHCSFYCHLNGRSGVPWVGSPREQALRELRDLFERMTSERTIGDGLDSMTSTRQTDIYTLVALELESWGPRWSQGNFDDFADVIGRVVVVSIFAVLNGNEPEAEGGGVLDALAFRPAITIRPNVGIPLRRDLLLGEPHLLELEKGLDAFAASTELLNAFSIKVFEFDREGHPQEREGEGRNFANVQCFDKNKRRIKNKLRTNENDAAEPAGVDVLVGLKSFDDARKMPGGVSVGDVCVPTEWVHPNTVMDLKYDLAVNYGRNRHLIAKLVTDEESSADPGRLPMTWCSKATGQPLAIMMHKKPVFPEADFSNFFKVRNLGDDAEAHMIDELMVINTSESEPSEMDLSFTTLPYVAIQVASPMTMRLAVEKTRKGAASSSSAPKKKTIDPVPAYGSTPKAAAGTFTLAVSLKRRAASADKDMRRIFCGVPEDDGRYSRNFGLCKPEGRFWAFAQFNIGFGGKYINAQGQKVQVGKMLLEAGPPGSVGYTGP